MAGAEPHRWVQDPLTPSGWRWTGDDTPPLDEQSRAYRGMTEAEVVPDDVLHLLAVRTHEPLDPNRHPGHAIRLPGDYEQDHWDAGRTDPR